MKPCIGVNTAADPVVAVAADRKPIFDPIPPRRPWWWRRIHRVKDAHALHLMSKYLCFRLIMPLLMTKRKFQGYFSFSISISSLSEN